MADLTEPMVNRRYETVASGTYTPEIVGLPGLTFVKMGLREKGASSRAYSAKLKELMNQGGYFNEALLPTILERTCRENGIDTSVIQKQRDILQRFWDSVPRDLQDPVDELTPEEVAELSPEELDARNQLIEARAQRFKDIMENFYKPEDYRILEQAKQIENLELQLRNNTAEHHARKHQMETEILLCARKSEDTEKPYFSSIEDIQELEDTNRDGLVQLYMKWKQFKEGLLPQFFRPDSTEMH